MDQCTLFITVMGRSRSPPKRFCLFPTFHRQQGWARHTLSRLLFVLPNAPRGRTHRVTGTTLCFPEMSQVPVWPGPSDLTKLSSLNSHTRESSPVTKTTIKAAGLVSSSIKKNLFFFWGLNYSYQIILDFFPFFSLKFLLSEKPACYIHFSIHLPLPPSSTYSFPPLLIRTEKWIWNLRSKG